jgi:hypothetical protein
MSIFNDPPKRAVRDVQIKIVVNPDEKAQIDALAERLGMTVAQLFRTAINEYAMRHSKGKK